MTVEFIIIKNSSNMSNWHILIIKIILLYNMWLAIKHVKSIAYILRMKSLINGHVDNI